MKTDSLSPEKSFEIITEIISQARNRFEENGAIYTFWGILIAIASFGQFILLKGKYYDISWYPYFLMPIGGIITGIYYYKKRQQQQNQISKIISVAWVLLSLNIMIIGFLFGLILRENLIPVILMLVSIGISISGVAIRSKLLIFSGIFINISALACFWVSWIYQPLLMGIVSILGILIPGIILMIQYKKRQNV